MSKVMQNYEQLAMATGLRLDRDRKMLYGLREGFELLVYAADERYPERTLTDGRARKR